MKPLRDSFIFTFFLLS